MKIPGSVPSASGRRFSSGRHAGLIGLAAFLCYGGTGIASLGFYRDDDAPAGEAFSPMRLLALGAAVYFFGYLVIAVSRYVPAPTAAENRLNLVPVAGIAIALAGILGPWWKSRKLQVSVAFCRQLEIPSYIHNPVAKWARGLLRMRHPTRKALADAG